jgi:DNA helicase HerA-like ATPase
MAAPCFDDIPQLIARIEGRERALRAPRPLDAVSFLRGGPFVHICALPREPIGAEWHWVPELLTGLHGLRERITFVAIRSADGLWLGLGCPWPRVLDGVLRGFVPESSLAEESPPAAVVSAADAMRWWSAILGTPNSPWAEPSGQQRVQDPAATGEAVPARAIHGLVDALLRGMGYEPWGLWVDMVPVATEETARESVEVGEHMRILRGELLQRGTIDEDNRLASHALELLEASFAKLLEGRRVGVWRTSTHLSSTNQQHDLIACSLARSALGGRSVLRPVSAIPCQGSPRGVEEDHDFSTPLTSIELARIVTPPSAETAGFARIRHADFDIAIDPAPSDAGARASCSSRSLAIGKIVERGRASSMWLDVDADDLCRHALVVGMTGSGKTNTILHMLVQLWSVHRIPFLVIEPVKAEYRSLLDHKSMRDAQLFTLGDERVCPFRWNPFEVPDGGSVQTHIDHMKTVFSASFVLYPPMPQVLEIALHEIYQDRGWDLRTNSNPRGQQNPRAFPKLSDLHAKVGEVVDRLGYDARLTMDVQAGLRARIQSLRIGSKGAMLDVRSSLPFDDLMERPTVVELGQVASDDEKAFLMGLLLTRLQEYHETRFRTGRLPVSAPLGHVTVLEEAHRLLRESSTTASGQDVADPRRQAVEAFTSLLAEVRAYGEGIIVADQIPTKLASEVVCNTNLKLMHRLASAEDRRVLGATMLLDGDQSDYVATLRPGRAVAYWDGADGSYLVDVPHAASVHGVHKDALTDQEAHAQMADRYRTDWKHLLSRLSACAECPVTVGGTAAVVELTEDDAAFREAASRFLVALIDGFAGVEPAFDSVVAALARLGRPRSRELEVARVTCALTHEVVRQIELRGRADGLSFSSLTRIEGGLVQFCKVWREAAGGEASGTLPSAGQTTSPIARQARELRLQLRRVLRSDCGPLYGCVACTSRCLFKEQGRALALKMAGDVRLSGHLSGSWDIERERGAKASILGVFEWVPYLTADARRDLSVCVAAHLGEQSALSAVMQAQLAESVLEFWRGQRVREEGPYAG